MQITEINVYAGRTFNHPFESYSNLKPSVSLKALLAPGEDATAAVRQLQAQAEQLVEDHKRILLQQLAEIEQQTRQEQERRRLEAEILTAQRRLDELRANPNAPAVLTGPPVGASPLDADVPPSDDEGAPYRPRERRY